MRRQRGTIRRRGNSLQVTVYAGLDPRKDVRWVTYPAPESIELLAQGTVDAFMGFPPQPQNMRAKGPPPRS